MHSRAVDSLPGLSTVGLESAAMIVVAGVIAKFLGKALVSKRGTRATISSNVRFARSIY